MTDLLPIIFTRGQNEIIDPRIAPPDVHAIARNVRWRKDGRPAKRYGVSPVTALNLATHGYSAQPVNTITSWNRNPVIVVGSSARQLTPNGWDIPQAVASGFPRAGEISHWGPGERQIIARDENSAINNATSGTSQGLVVHAWEGGLDVYYAVTRADGRMVISPRLLVAGAAFPRCVSTNGFVYVLSRSGTSINCHTFDPVTLGVTAGPSLGTLAASTYPFDACGRGNDFVLVYHAEDGGSQLQAVKIFSATNPPTQIAAEGSVTLPASLCRFGVVGTSTSSIFTARLETATGALRFVNYTNTLSAVQNSGTIVTDTTHDAQPGLVVVDNTTAIVVFGSFNPANDTSVMRWSQISSLTGAGPPGGFPSVTPASKPFMGPAIAGLPEVDGPYVWVATHNANNGNTKWDSQRAYYLVRFTVGSSVLNWLVRHLHAPGVPPSTTCQLHLSDVLRLPDGLGYLTPLLNAVRFGNGLTPTLGVDAVSFFSIFASLREAARDTVTAGRALQISGGALYEINGSAEETGFSNFPVIHSLALNGAGGLAANSSYQYRAVFEWLDDEGRRHRSAPSDPVTIQTGASAAAVDVTLKLLIASNRADKRLGLGVTTTQGVVTHIYRTLAGQATFHRVTPNVGAPRGFLSGSATVLFTDTMSDAIAGLQEFIYTDGGVADNTLPPPHDFLTVCSGRVWLGGQLDRCVITASKILVDSEPTQFSDLEQFSVFLPEKCTGLASLDGTVIAFAREKIYLIGGEGPNDQGIGLFSPPSELPTDVGCIDWRSVVETSAGVFFQSKRGIYLLPRGFNTPQFVGGEVEQTLAAFPIISSATVVTMPSSNDGASLGEVTVRFVACADETGAPSAVLVYDLRTGGWSVDELNEGPRIGGTWEDAFITARNSGGVLQLHRESAREGYASPENAFISSVLGTGDIRPFGLAGYGNFDCVTLVGEFRGSAQVTVQVSVDGESPDSHVLPVTGSDVADRSVYLDITPRIRKGSAIRVTCSDSAGAPGEGFIMQALFLEYEAIGKVKRLPTARRA